MKKGLIAGAALLVIGAGLFFLLKPKPKPVEAPKIVAPTGPDPVHLAKVAELARTVEELEQKGLYDQALEVLKKLAALEPADPRPAAFKPRLEEKLGRLKAWRAAHAKAVEARDDAQRRATVAEWQKVLDLCAEAEKHAPLEEQQRQTRELAALARQNLPWLQAREEEKKGNLAAALDLVTRAIEAREAPPELAAYKSALEKKKRKQDFDRSAALARAELAPTRAYELWKQAKTLADDAKDVEEVDRRLDALLPKVDPAERERRYGLAMKAAEAALAAEKLDEAEKAFRDAQSLKGGDAAAGQGLSKVDAARKRKGYDTAMAEARVAEGKREWSDAIEAYDRALRMKPADPDATARRREVEETRRPPRLTLVLEPSTGIKLDFVLIKRGAFRMGDERGDADEKPRDVVIAKDYYLQVTEVTQRQWEFVARSKPFSFTGSPEVPVEGVSWIEVQKFLEKLNAAAQEQLKGRKAGLPTEAEWEYACRAGTKTRWSFGDDEAKLEDFGWYTRTSGKGPQPVGKKGPNAWGLFDMHGNVAEWCEDAYASDPAKAAEAAAVDDAPRSIRGGSWNDRAANLRSGNREKDIPTKGCMFTGFRVVLR